MRYHRSSRRAGRRLITAGLLLMLLLVACTPPAPSGSSDSKPAATTAPKPASESKPSGSPAAASAPAAASPAAAGSPSATGSPAAAGSPAAVAGQSSTIAAVLAPASDRIRYRDEPPATGQPKPGGTLRVLLRIDGQSLDPHKTTEATVYIFCEQMYDTLVESDLGEIKPGLAESWTVTPNGLTYTFKLRSGVTFHSGRPLTSEDVKYSIERVRDPKTASPRQRNLDAVDAIQTPDPQTVTIVLKEPFAPLLSNLAAIGLAIVDKQVVEQTGDLNTADGGSGPFKLKEWVRDTRLVVEKNPTYWRAGQPYLDSVTFTFNPDDNARAAAIRSAGIDYLYRADAAFVDILKRDASLKWYGGVSGSWSYLLMNVQRKPYDDVRVRQAIMWALDRAAIMDTANSGFGEPLTGGFLSPSKWGALKSPAYPARDLARAKALLAEAGQASGFKTTLNVLSTSAFHVRAAQAVQQQLKEIGIDIDIRTMESGVMNRELRESNFDLQVSAFGGTVDPDERLSQSFVTGGGTNYAKFSDKAVDDLVTKARQASDRNERERLYEQIQQVLSVSGPMAYTYGWADHDFVLKKVQGFTFDPAPNYRGFRQTWIGE